VVTRAARSRAARPGAGAACRARRRPRAMTAGGVAASCPRAASERSGLATAQQ
jgi:hypothetical protein